MLINKTCMLIVAGNALWFLTRSATVIPFSVDLLDFCWRIREEGDTTIKIYVGDDVLFINEVQNVLKRNSFFENLDTI